MFPSLLSPTWFSSELVHFLTTKIENGDVDAVQEFDGNVNGRLSCGNTLLHLAAERGNLEMCDMLIGKGADVNVLNICGESVLYFAVRNNRFEICQLLFGQQTKSHKCKTANRLSNLADPNLRDNCGETPLHRAAWIGSFKLCKLLLTHGAKVDILDKYGQTPLHRAFFSVPVIKLLLKHGTNINAQDEDGQTLLHNVVSRGLFKQVKLLVDMGADVNIKDNKGKTPLCLCLLFKRNISKFLIYNGATMGGMAYHDRVKEENEKWRQEYLMRQAIRLFTVFKVRHPTPLRYTIPNIYIVGQTVIAACFPDLTSENRFSVEQMFMKKFGEDDKVVAPEDRLDQLRVKIGDV